MDIEDYVCENCIGVDFWRRIGVCCFIGNIRRGLKIIDNWIMLYLENKYDIRFGYGKIV